MIHRLDIHHHHHHHLSMPQQMHPACCIFEPLYAIPNKAAEAAVAPSSQQQQQQQQNPSVGARACIGSRGSAADVGGCRAATFGGMGQCRDVRSRFTPGHSPEVGSRFTLGHSPLATTLWSGPIDDNNNNNNNNNNDNNDNDIANDIDNDNHDDDNNNDDDDDDDDNDNDNDHDHNHDNDDDDDGSVASKILACIPPMTKSVSSPSLAPGARAGPGRGSCCKESVRETPYQRSLKLKRMKLQHCAEELGSESSGSDLYSAIDAECDSAAILGSFMRSPSSSPSSPPSSPSSPPSPSSPSPPSSPSSSSSSSTPPTAGIGPGALPGGIPTVRSSPELASDALAPPRPPIAARSFPPPLSHPLPLSHSPRPAADEGRARLRAFREPGRFVLVKEATDPHPGRRYLHADRKDGRLTLHLLTPHDEDLGHDDDHDHHDAHHGGAGAGGACGGEYDDDDDDDGLISANPSSTDPISAPQSPHGFDCVDSDAPDPIPAPREDSSGFADLDGPDDPISASIAASAPRTGMQESLGPKLRGGAHAARGRCDLLPMPTLAPPRSPDIGLAAAGIFTSECPSSNRHALEVSLLSYIPRPISSSLALDDYTPGTIIVTIVLLVYGTACTIEEVEEEEDDDDDDDDDGEEEDDGDDGDDEQAVAVPGNRGRRKLDAKEDDSGGGCETAEKALMNAMIEGSGGEPRRSDVGPAPASIPAVQSPIGAIRSVDLAPPIGTGVLYCKERSRLSFHSRSFMRSRPVAIRS